MTKPLIVLPQAERELREAAAAYEERAPGLARAFVRELRAVFTHVEKNPGLYARVEADVRRAPLHRFPFGVFYLESDEKTTVLAVLDLRREPAPRRGLVAARAREATNKP